MLGNLSGSFLAIYFGKSFYAFRFDFAKLKQMLAFSVPLVPSSVGSLLMLYINRIAINSIMTLADVGIYGLAFRITSIMEIIMMGFRTALIPLIYNNHQKEETPEEIAKIFRYFVAFALIGVLFLSFFSHEIIVILSQPSYYSAANIVAIMAPAYVFSQMYIFTQGWAIAKKTKYFAFINIIGSIIAIGLNFSLIPVLGITGAAWANLITYILIFVASMVLSQHYYYVPHKWMGLLTALISFLGLYGLGTYLVPATGYLLNIAIKLLILLIGTSFLIFIRLIEPGDIIKISSQLSRFINERVLKTKRIK
jgi:O-antigen/teichoic acid export membrane protein